jgi:hypothetical protein
VQAAQQAEGVAARTWEMAIEASLTRSVGNRPAFASDPVGPALDLTSELWKRPGRYRLTAPPTMGHRPARRHCNVVSDVGPAP